MSTWREERRKDQAAEAEEKRKNREFEARLMRDERRKDRDEKRQEKTQRRRDKAQRKQARAARRQKQLTPGNVYRKGTLGLVGVSAAAALPAQLLYFVKKSLWLIPVPFALEGAAWVMAAGVAYADEKKLPAWVRWLLRALCVSAAAFAARINYLHGAETSPSVGWGLAAVTMLGPLFFEVRQWVITLSAVTATPKQQAADRAKARHEKRRRKHHKDVCALADRLISAAPYGALTFEEAFAKAWHILTGSPDTGMTLPLHAIAAASAEALAQTRGPRGLSAKNIRDRITSRLGTPDFILPTPPGTPIEGIKKTQVASDLPPASDASSGGVKKKARKQPPPHRRSKGDALPFHPLAKSAAGHTARQYMAVNGHHH